MTRDETQAPEDPGQTAEAEQGVEIDGLPVETWLDVCLSDIHGALEGILPEMARSGPEARRRLENILGYAPPPELLGILHQVARAPEQSVLRMGLGRVLIVVAILARREIFALTEPRQVEPGMLQRQARTLPALARRVQSLEEDIRAVPPVERDRLRRLRVSLIPPLSRLHGLTVLVSRLHELTEAARAGRLAPEHGLTPAEEAWFKAAVGRTRAEEDLVPRALLDGVALRIGLGTDLEAHYNGTSSRSRLEACAAAYELAVERLEGAEKDALAREQGALVRRLSRVRNELQRLDRKLGAILRGSRERTDVSGGPAIRSIFQYQTPAWIAAAAILALVVILALVAPSRSGASPGSEPEPPAPAAAPPVEVEFNRMDRNGDSLIAEVTSWTWSRMPEEQRQDEMYGLGVMAFSQGAREVWIVDEEGRELAKWSRGGNITFLDPDR